MPAKKTIILAAVAAAMGIGASPAAHAACSAAGVITRIVGQPQDVVLTRDGAAISRVRVLEVLCAGDTVEAKDATVITLSIDGDGPQTVTSKGPYAVVAKSTSASVAGNAYDALSEHVLKDMKRQPWDVRLRAPGPMLSFGVAGLTDGKQKVTAGQRDMLVRVDGGIGAYHVILTNAAGATVAEASGSDNDVVLKGVTLAPGQYRLEVSDSSGAKQSAGLTAMATRPPLTATAGIGDPEVGAALQAAELARTAPDWTFESQQILNAAPRANLDRESVYRLIESYGDDGPA